MTQCSRLTLSVPLVLTAPASTRGGSEERDYFYGSAGVTYIHRSTCQPVWSKDARTRGGRAGWCLTNELEKGAWVRDVIVLRARSLLAHFIYVANMRVCRHECRMRGRAQGQRS